MHHAHMQVSDHFHYTRDVYVEEGDQLGPDEFNAKVSLSVPAYKIGVSSLQDAFTDKSWLPAPFVTTAPPHTDSSVGASAVASAASPVEPVGAPASSAPAAVELTPASVGSSPIPVVPSSPKSAPPVVDASVGTGDAIDDDMPPLLSVADTVILLPDGPIAAPPAPVASGDVTEIVTPKDVTAEEFEQFMTLRVKSSMTVRVSP